MRTFVAIALPYPVRDALSRVQDALGVGRPADPDQLHLTLAFLGERPEADVEAAHWALTRVAVTPFEAQLAGLGTFEDRVVWAGLRDPAPVQALHARILSALHGAGIMLERRRYRPHVTLARLDPLGPGEAERLARALARHQAFPSAPFAVEGFGLWRSTLHKAGAIHEELARYPE